MQITQLESVEYDMQDTECPEGVLIMTIQTSVFGELLVDESKIITFKEGLPGFEDLHRFILVILEQTRPFLWLQAVDRDIAIPVISPFDIVRDYAPVVDDGIFDAIELERQEDLLVLAVAVIPPEVNLMTANLAAPILINIVANQGLQVLAENSEYLVRQPIFDAICQQLCREDNHAGSDTPK